MGTGAACSDPREQQRVPDGGESDDDVALSDLSESESDGSEGFDSAEEEMPGGPAF
jgi:hypothetical protein